MSVVVGPGWTIGPGWALGSGSGPATTLLLSLDATSYSGSGTTWTALTGSNATLVNSPGYTAASPTYFTFNAGSLQMATVPALSSLSTWTVECWFMATGNLSTQITTLAGDVYASNNINFSLAFNPVGQTTGVLQAALYNNNDGGWHYTSGFVPTQNTWYQSVGTYDGSALKQYSNGALQSSQSYTGTPSSGGSGIRIAGRWDSISSSVDHFPGRIAIVKIYEGDIGAGGVTTSWNANKARFGL